MFLDQVLAETATEVKGNLCRVEKGSPEGGQFTNCATATKDAPLSAKGADRLVAAVADMKPETPPTEPVTIYGVGTAVQVDDTNVTFHPHGGLSFITKDNLRLLSGAPPGSAVEVSQPLGSREGAYELMVRGEIGGHSFLERGILDFSREGTIDYSVVARSTNVALPAALWQSQTFQDRVASQTGTAQLLGIAFHDHTREAQTNTPANPVNAIHVHRIGMGDTVRVDDDSLTFTRPGNGATAAISKADLVALTGGGSSPVVLGGTLRLEVDSGSGTVNTGEFQWKVSLKDDYHTYGKIELTNTTASPTDAWDVKASVQRSGTGWERDQAAAMERLTSRGFTASVELPSTIALPSSTPAGPGPPDHMPEPLNSSQLYPEATDTQLTTSATSGNPVINGSVKIYIQANIGVTHDNGVLTFADYGKSPLNPSTQIRVDELRKILAVPSDGIIRISTPNDNRTGYDIYTQGTFRGTTFTEYYHLNVGRSIGLINRSTTEDFPTASGIVERDRLQYADIHDYVSRGGLSFSIRNGRGNYTTDFSSLIDLNSRDREAGNAPTPSPASRPRVSSSTYREPTPEPEHVPQVNMRPDLILYTGEDVRVSYTGSREREPEWLDQAAALAGAPPDTELEVKARYSGSYSLNARGDGISIELTVNDDEKSIYADGIFLDRGTQKGGIGSRAMATMLYNARELGFNKFTLSAAGHHGGSMNGYYTWPRLGFDGRVQSDTAEQAAQDLGIEVPSRISEIFDAEGGADWWRVNGHGFSASFDMTEGSRSWRRLGRYMEHRFGNNPFERRRPPRGSSRPIFPGTGFESVLRPDSLFEDTQVAGNLCRQEAGSPAGGQFIACDVAPLDVAALNKEANAIVAQQLMRFPEDPRLSPSPTEIVMHPTAMQQFTKGEVKFYGHGTGDDGGGIRPIELYANPPLALDRDQLRRMVGAQAGTTIHISDAGDDLYTFRVSGQGNLALGAFALKPDMQGNYHFWQTERGVDFSYRPMPMGVLMAIPADGKDSKELQAESEQAMKSASDIVMGTARGEWEAMGGKSAPLWIPENPDMEISVQAGKQYNYGGHPNDPDAPSYTYFEKPVLDTDTGTLKLDFVGPHSEPNPNANPNPDDYNSKTIYTYPTTKLDIQVDDLVAAIGTSDKITISSVETKPNQGLDLSSAPNIRYFKIEGDNDIDWKMSYREYVGTDGELHKELNLDGQHYNDGGIDPDNMPSINAEPLRSYLEERGVHLDLDEPYEKIEDEEEESTGDEEPSGTGSYYRKFQTVHDEVNDEVKRLESLIADPDNADQHLQHDYKERLETHKSFAATEDAAKAISFDTEEREALGFYFGTGSRNIGLGQQGRETPTSMETIEAFEAATDQMPTFSGTVYHGRKYSQEKADEYVSKLLPGDEVKFTRTYSSSLSLATAKSFSNTLLFKIHTKSARAAAWFSTHDELEGLVTKGTWYKVLGLTKESSGRHIVEVEEIDSPTAPPERRHEAYYAEWLRAFGLEEANDCHEPAGSSKGGQFCSKDGDEGSVVVQHLLPAQKTGGPGWNSYTDLARFDTTPIVKDPSALRPYLTGTVEINKDRAQVLEPSQIHDSSVTWRWSVDQDAITFHPAGTSNARQVSDSSSNMLSPGLYIGLRSGPEITIDRDQFTRMVGAADGGRIEITPSANIENAFGIKVYNPDHEDLGDGRDDDGQFSLFFRSPADAQMLNDNDSEVSNGTKPAFASGWIFGSSGGRDIEGTIRGGQEGGAEDSISAREMVITQAWQEWQNQGGVIEFDTNMAEHFQKPEPEEDPEDSQDESDEDESDEDEIESEEEAQLGGPAHAITSDLLGEGSVFDGEDVNVSDNSTNLDDKEIALLAGAPPGSTVTVSPGGDGDFALFVRGEHTSDQLVRVRDGHMEFARYFPESGFQQGGLGAKIFGTIVAGARRNGYDSIKIHAIGDSSSLDVSPNNRASGYLAWVKMGGDASLDSVEFRRSSYSDQVHFDWPGSHRISDIVNKPGGMTWWEEHGGEWFGSFDTRDGSYSMKRLGSYLKKKFGKNPFGEKNEFAPGEYFDESLEEALEVIAGDLCRDERGRFTSCTAWAEGQSGIELTSRAYDRVPALQGDPGFIRDFALKYGDATTETAAIFVGGEPVLIKAGSHDTLHFTREELSLMEDAVYIHNHPEGSSFSYQDLHLAMNNNMAEMRAVSSVRLPEAYGQGESFQMVTLKRPPGGWPKIHKLTDVYEDIEAEVTNEFQDRITRGEVSYAWANFTHRDEINKRVVAALGMPVESYLRVVVGRPQRAV